MCVSHAARDFFTQRRRLTDPRQAHRRELAQELLLRGVPRRAKLGERTPRRQKQGKPLEATQPRAATAAAEASSSGTTRPSLGLGPTTDAPSPGLTRARPTGAKGWHTCRYSFLCGGCRSPLELDDSLSRSPLELGPAGPIQRASVSAVSPRSAVTLPTRATHHCAHCWRDAWGPRRLLPVATPADRP